MEALLEREGTVENWNDDRMDELSQTMKEGFAKVDQRFERVEGEMKEGFAKADRETSHRFDKVDHEFGRLNDRLDKILWGVGFAGLTLALNLLVNKLPV